MNPSEVISRERGASTFLCEAQGHFFYVLSCSVKIVPTIVSLIVGIRVPIPVMTTWNIGPNSKFPVRKALSYMHK